MILDSINSPADIKSLSIDQMKELADEIRDYIVDVVSSNGGHLASSLGVVELTLALHHVFNTPEDIIIWDVGHQCYAHKIITGRREEFQSLRKLGGISGFPKMKESPYDSFNVGHSSTSLSLALGCAVARDLNEGTHKVIAVIGDGSLTGGIAFEALNNIGHMANDLIIILNDNEHSISKNVGALSRYLTRIIADPRYNRVRRKSMAAVKRIPRLGPGIFRFFYSISEGFKGLITPGRLFDDMGIRYFGPVDGNNLPLLMEILKNVKEINYGPKIIHIITKKGKGYGPAEKDPARFHGTGPFDKATGIPEKRNIGLSYSDIAGKTITSLAAADEKIVAITAAMKLGTGLYEFERCFPGRFFDVGIAEQHAVTFAAAMASRGMRPFVSIYSTFLQRAVDQVIHDVAIMNLPVRLLVDRAGIVGDDGETHHGLFDIAVLRNIPNMMILAPSSGSELRDMICFAAGYDKGPVAIRFPRGSVRDEIDITTPAAFRPGKIRLLSSGVDIAILALGDMVRVASEAAGLLKMKSINAAVVNILTVKPLDHRGIERCIARSRHFIVMENGVASGGIGEGIVASLPRKLQAKLLFLCGFPDHFVSHGTNEQLLAAHGLDAPSLARRIHGAIRKK